MTLSTEYVRSSLQQLYTHNVTAANIREWCKTNGTTYQTVTKKLEQYKVGRGSWNLTIQEAREQFEEMVATPEKSLVPLVDENYVPFGNFTDVKKIIKSGSFYPMFITGMSGNGKTVSVEQACAQLKRELIRVNITIETDENDLICGQRLSDGNSVFHDGPVIEALRRGAILLLDEVDLASNKILCLQPVLEGKGLYVKATGEYIKPAPGFNVIATANTKGKGSDDGRFIGTNVLNEAFLERFALTFEQEYPTPTTEAKILGKLCYDEDFVAKLVDWADVIRKTFKDGGVDEVISTRRLIHIVNAFDIWGKREKAIKLCINRFDSEVKDYFWQLYTKLDIDATKTEEVSNEN